jgi:hypothetical protein
MTGRAGSAQVSLDGALQKAAAASTLPSATAPGAVVAGVTVDCAHSVDRLFRADRTT